MTLKIALNASNFLVYEMQPKVSYFSFRTRIYKD
jgi:hypothetical protein